MNAPERHVLIIEDDVDLARALSEAFDDEGWQTSELHDGLRAVGTVVRDRPSLILLDIRLERADTGWVLLTLLRETLESTRDIPAIVLSGTPSLGVQRLAWLREQGIPFVTKPAELGELLHLAESLVRRARNDADRE